MPVTHMKGCECLVRITRERGRVKFLQTYEPEALQEGSGCRETRRAIGTANRFTKASGNFHKANHAANIRLTNSKSERLCKSIPQSAFVAHTSRASKRH